MKAEEALQAMIEISERAPDVPLVSVCQGLAEVIAASNGLSNQSQARLIALGAALYKRSLRMAKQTLDGLNEDLSQRDPRR